MLPEQPNQSLQRLLFGREADRGHSFLRRSHSVVLYIPPHVLAECKEDEPQELETEASRRLRIVQREIRVLLQVQEAQARLRQYLRKCGGSNLTKSWA